MSAEETRRHARIAIEASVVVALLTIGWKVEFDFRSIAGWARGFVAGIALLLLAEWGWSVIRVPYKAIARRRRPQKSPLDASERQ